MMDIWLQVTIIISSLCPREEQEFIGEISYSLQPRWKTKELNWNKTGPRIGCMATWGIKTAETNWSPHLYAFGINKFQHFYFPMCISIWVSMAEVRIRFRSGSWPSSWFVLRQLKEQNGRRDFRGPICFHGGRGTGLNFPLVCEKYK